MRNGRMLGAAAVALMIVTGASTSLTFAQAAKKKGAAKAAAAGPVPTAEEIASAEEAYKTKCAICHTMDGNSPLPMMNFSDGDWKHGSSIPELMKTIAEGVQGTAMMPFKAQFTEGEIAALARKVRSFDKKLK